MKSKRLVAPDVDQIRRAICSAYDVDESSLLSSRSGIPKEPRNVAVLLARRLRGKKLEEIGRYFGMAKYSSVSYAIEKMKRKISLTAGC